MDKLMVNGVLLGAGITFGLILGAGIGNIGAGLILGIAFGVSVDLASRRLGDRGTR